MIAERDRALTYYVDSSVWNQLSHQPEPGRPECVARLKRARDENQAHTYMSRHLFQELIATFKNSPPLGRRLMKTVHSIAHPVWLVKDTPVLKEQDVRRLVDPSMSGEYLEPYGSIDADKVRRGVDVLARDGTLDQESIDFCTRWAQKAYDYKIKYLDLWAKLIEDHRKKFEMDTIPENYAFADFMGDTNRAEVRLAMIDMWTPVNLKTVMPLADLANRLDETVSYRGMLYYMACYYFWKVFKKEEPDRGDGFDAHHGLIAANFDVFVCKDENASKYAQAFCRNGQRVLTLDEFIKDLG